MIKIRNYVLIIFLIFIYACGYEPLNKSLTENDIKISKKTFSGDNQINRKIFNQINLKETKDEPGFELKLNSNKIISEIGGKNLFCQEIEESLKSLYFVKKVEEVETNIIIFEINSNYSSDIFINKLQKKGVKLIGMGDNKLRLVTHLDYSDNHHEAFLDILSKVTL